MLKTFFCVKSIDGYGQRVNAMVDLTNKLKNMSIRKPSVSKKYSSGYEV
jgi:hypothetical protein